MRMLMAMLLASALSTGAEAATIDNVTSLDIAVQGSVGQHCALGSVGDMDFGDLNRTGLSIRARVPFDCNVPFTMTVKGRNGALANRLAPNGQGPYSGKLPYSLGIEMALRHPSTELVNKTFESRQIQSGSTISSNGAIATDDMFVAVELGAPSGEEGLLAGDYAETITITVSPT